MTLIGSSLTTFGDSTLQQINASFDIVKHILIDGREKIPPEDMKPFVYNGRTYVPLRYVSETLGKEVTWNNSTGTVTIQNYTKFEKEPTNKLELQDNLANPIELNYDYIGTSFDNDYAWYKFKLDTDKRISINFTQCQDDTTWDIEVYKASSESQKDFNRTWLICDFESSNKNGASMEIGLSSGTYYIKVSNREADKVEYKIAVNG